MNANDYNTIAQEAIDAEYASIKFAMLSIAQEGNFSSDFFPDELPENENLLARVLDALTQEGFSVERRQILDYNEYGDEIEVDVVRISWNLT